MTLAAKRGLQYPLQTNGNGGLATSTDLSLVRQHILSVIETRPYERVMRASYGLPDFIFDTIDPELINSRIQSAIEQEVLELESLEVSGEWVSTGDDGIYQVKIEYEVNGVPQPPVAFALQR